LEAAAPQLLLDSCCLLPTLCRAAAALTSLQQKLLLVTATSSSCSQQGREHDPPLGVLFAAILAIKKLHARQHSNRQPGSQADRQATR
jgi:hypothetical protein